MKIKNFQLCSLLFALIGLVNNIEVIIGAKTFFVLAAFAFIIILRLTHQSKVNFTYSYMKGFLDSLFIGITGTFLFCLFSVISGSIWRLKAGDDYKDAASYFLMLVPNGVINIVFASIGIFGLAVILPLFFIKNKTLEKDIILDEEI